MRAQKMLKLLTVGIVVVSCALFSVGCGGKKKPKPVKSATPQVTKTATPASDTTDIFKEFYSDDNGASAKGKGKQAKAVKQQKQKATKAAPAVSAKSNSNYTPQFSDNGAYTVQISCVRSQSFANKLAEKMKAKGYPAYVAEVSSPTPALSGTYYRIRISGFSGVAQAKEFGENALTADGFSFWVDKKSNDNVGLEGSGIGSGSVGTSSSAPAPATTSSSKSSASYEYQGSSSSSSSSSPATTTPAPAATPAATSAATPAATPATSSDNPYTVPASASPSPSSTETGSAATSSSSAATPASNSSTAPASSSTPAATPAKKDSSSGAGW